MESSFHSSVDDDDDGENNATVASVAAMVAVLPQCRERAFASFVLCFAECVCFAGLVVI